MSLVIPHDLAPLEKYLLQNGYTFQGYHGHDRREFRDESEKSIYTQFFRKTWIPSRPGLGIRQDRLRGRIQKIRGLTPRETYRLMRVVDFPTIVRISEGKYTHILAVNEQYYLVHRHPWHNPANRTLLNM